LPHLLEKSALIALFESYPGERRFNLKFCPRLLRMPTREDAWQLVCEWTESDSLRKHMLAVEAAVRAYARRLGGDEELWGIAALVHDLDYERHPDLETGHPRYAIEELRTRGYPEEVIHAVLGHADFMGVPRESALDKALFACDELAGFIAACAYVRPEGIDGMKPKSVKKKLKQPSFAAGVNRDDVLRGAEELEPLTGMSFDEHLQFTIDALAEQADTLGLTGRRETAPAD
jgi:putative nucleotidyltransferase with HDIG domain